MGPFQKAIMSWAPWWMRGPVVGTLLEASGATLDALAQRSFDGRRAAIPYAGGARSSGGQLLQCEEDVLTVHSVDRGIKLYSTEPVSSQRIRLGSYLQLRSRRGTPRGEEEHVQPYFLGASGLSALPTIRIVFQTNQGTPSAVWSTLAANGTYSVVARSPSNWDWDGQPSKRTRWWAIVYLPPGYSTAFDYDSGVNWDSGAIWDGVGATNLADLYAMFRDWKSAHAWFAGLIVTALQPTDDIPGAPGRHPFDPADTAFTLPGLAATSLPTGNWGTSVYTSGASGGLPTRPPWAIFYNLDNG